MRCQAQICPTCRLALKEIIVLRGSERAKGYECTNCKKVYDTPLHVICGSNEFRTLESYKREHNTINTRLVMCTSCGTCYSTIEKIDRVMEGVSGYIKLRNATLGNIDLFENDEKPTE